MPRCPHCGQQTSRTKDWACQWCGYPLLLRSYREIPMTYQELKEKGPRQEAMTVSDRIGTSLPAELVTESEVEVESEAEVEEEAEAVVEAEAESEAEVEEEAEAVVEAEPEPEREPKPEREREPKAKAKAKFKLEAVPETKAITEAWAAPEPEPESASGEMAITVEELQSAFADDGPCVVLISSEKTVLRNVLCVFDKKHAPELKLLVPGQTVTVQGKYDSCTINILVTDCVLVS